jgi:hypothetical protein
MGTYYAIIQLRDKRARLAGEIAKAERVLAANKRDLANLDAVIRLFEPQTNPELIPAVRPTSRRSLFFKHGEQMRLACDVLRESAKPMRCRTVAEGVMLRKGLPVENEALVQSVSLQVRVAFFLAVLAVLELEGIDLSDL